MAYRTSSPVEIIPIDEHQLLIFWVQFVVLVLVARLLGALMNRIGQPAVVGELAAGLVLGPHGAWCAMAFGCGVAFPSGRGAVGDAAHRRLGWHRDVC
jgi:Kef-type K+ transport system membrane component KefB